MVEDNAQQELQVKSEFSNTSLPHGGLGLNLPLILTPAQGA